MGQEAIGNGTATDADAVIIARGPVPMDQENDHIKGWEIMNLRPKIDTKRMISESKPDVAMILWAIKKAKASMTPDEHAKYGLMIEKNIPKFERYLEKLEAKQ